MNIQFGNGKSRDGSADAAAHDYMGYRLILVGMLATSVVAIGTLALLKSNMPTQVTVADVVAVISSVTGVFGTLVAAFFGVRGISAANQQTASLVQEVQRTAQQRGAGIASVTKIDPSRGPHEAVTRISIYGNGFTGANIVNFGNTPGTGFQLVNDNLIEVTAPPADGRDSVDVTVVFPGAAQPNVSAGTFYYYTVKPDGSDEVVVEGDPTGFKNLRAVEIGTVPTTDFTTEGRELHVHHVPHDGKTSADVTLVYSVDSPTNRYTVGTVAVPRARNER